MGKHRHSQDKLWLSYKELVELYGGKSSNITNTNINLNKLPFNCCSLSFTPFENPFCNKEGFIFDVINILPYVKKYEKDPITGKNLKTNELLKLNFFKNNDGEYHCPITYKTFSDDTNIIAIRETGNVYSLEAYKNLNEKENYYKDLVNEVEFNKANVIHLKTKQKFSDIANNYFVLNNQNLELITNKDNSENSIDNNVNITSNYKEILHNYNKNYNDKDNEEIVKRKDILKSINSHCNNTIFTTKILNSQNKELIDKEIIDYNNNKSIIKDKVIKLINFNDVIMNNIFNLKQKIIDNNIDYKNIKTCLEDLYDITSLAKKSLSKDILENLYSKLNISTFTYFYLDLDNRYNLNTNLNEGYMSKSTTSTLFNKSNNYYDNKSKLSIYERRLLVYKQIKEEALLSINTNYGVLNIMLYCKQAPKTCENFITLCELNRYNGTLFHRLIKGFVMQGGDYENNDGTGGTSIFGNNFEDEFSNLKHNKRGILSMANSGPNTNNSQFFIIFKEQPHLDKKHTVFGEVVGNISLLDNLELQETDNFNKPINDIIINNISIHKNPFREVVSKCVLDEIFNEAIYDVLLKYLQINQYQLKTNDNKPPIKNIQPVNNNIKTMTITNKDNEIGKYLNRKRILTESNNEFDNANNQNYIKELIETGNNYYINNSNTNTTNEKNKPFVFKNW